MKIMENKQTAMQQLINEIVEHLTYDDDLSDDSRMTLETIRLKCLGKLSVEKEQIIDAFWKGDNTDCTSEQNSKEFAEQYYIETYESKESDAKDVILGYKTSLDAQMLDKVEPKQETLDCPFDFTSRCTMGSCDCKPKQETNLEEAAEKYANELPEPYNYGINSDKKKGFIEGAKWQTEQNNTSKVNRVEVIQHSPPYNGRAYTNYNAKNVEIQFQDDNTTLKIFLK
jgi:hypothetical protein